MNFITDTDSRLETNEFCNNFGYNGTLLKSTVSNTELSEFSDRHGEQGVSENQ